MTDKIAYFIDGRFLYWQSIILAAAVLTAILAAVAMRLWQRKSLSELLIVLPVAIVLSVAAARFVHWYCRFESYESFSAAMTNLSGGGYSLIGVFAGTLAACCLIRLLRVTRDLPALLDCLSPAAALGIAVGRFSALFSAADRGKILVTDPAWQRLPFGSAVTNSISGATEWRFATFCFQAIFCAVIFLVLVIYFFRARQRRHSGDVFFLFMTLYCLGQILLDSTRYDALFLRGNGFVSLEQIVCAVCVGAIIAQWSVRAIRAGGFRGGYILTWLSAVIGLGIVGFAEWFVQREGDRYLLAYSVMAAGLVLVFAAAALLKRSAERALATEDRSAERPSPVPAARERYVREAPPVHAVAPEPEPPRAPAPEPWEAAEDDALDLDARVDRILEEIRNAK